MTGHRPWNTIAHKSPSGQVDQTWRVGRLAAVTDLLADVEAEHEWWRTQRRWTRDGHSLLVLWFVGWQCWSPIAVCGPAPGQLRVRGDADVKQLLADADPITETDLLSLVGDSREDPGKRLVGDEDSDA